MTDRRDTRAGPRRRAATGPAAPASHRDDRMLVGAAATATSVVVALIAVPAAPQGVALALGGTLGLAATGLLTRTASGRPASPGRATTVVGATAIGWAPIIAARLLAN